MTADTALQRIIDRYGLRLDVDQLADLLKLSPGTIRNRIAAGRMPICYRDGGRVFADARDVAAYLDSLRPVPRVSQEPAEPRRC